MALRYIFIFDAAQSYMHLNPLFSLSGNASLPITAQGYGFCCVNIIAYMARVYCSVQLQYTLLGAFCVTIGFYDAKDFPPLFGRWRDAYTLRRFWGSVYFPLFPLKFAHSHIFRRTWHQMMRRVSLSRERGVLC